jgi:hypothetical protein
MKKLHHSLLLTGIVVALTATLTAQTFGAGSDESDGEFNLGYNQSRTLQVPEDGVFNFTTFNTEQRGIVYFRQNAARTPITILCSGNFTHRGRIYVHGGSANSIEGALAGPGGFPGGKGGEQPADGLGPGGGKGGWSNDDAATGTKPSGTPYRGGGSYGSRSSLAEVAATAGPIYGNNLLIPPVGGSGGGGGQGATFDKHSGGGGGGGAITIASNTLISFSNWEASQYNPSIRAYGGSGSGNFGGGSGGSIRLIAPNVQGQVWLNVAPGDQTAGFGRIRIDRIQPGEVTLYDIDGDPAVLSSNNFATFGSNMVVTPPNLPLLRIVEAANQPVAPDRNDPVFVLLPPGAPAAQTVRVAVTNFNDSVPLRCILTPETGEKLTYDFTVDNSAGGSTEGSVQVQVPSGVTTRVDVWTR